MEPSVRSLVERPGQVSASDEADHVVRLRDHVVSYLGRGVARAELHRRATTREHLVPREQGRASVEGTPLEALGAAHVGDDFGRTGEITRTGETQRDRLR